MRSDGKSILRLFGRLGNDAPILIEQFPLGHAVKSCASRIDTITQEYGEKWQFDISIVPKVHPRLRHRPPVAQPKRVRTQLAADEGASECRAACVESNPISAAACQPAGGVES